MIKMGIKKLQKRGIFIDDNNIYLFFYFVLI
jgi:hypothetical protein